MKVLVIGGTGHIGSYLGLRLVQAGHAVTVVSRHPRPQYTHPRLCWPAVEWVTADRRQEEDSGAWGERMRQLEADAVIDLI
ncbi:MAG: NAD-dependent epimerase/dehydratase family protein [Candidatus Latescibacterota bacterium]